ncbi:MAG: hypothetical protein QOD89_672 [Bradyrhizobium sp.]|jgi:hypothetical protein|nr:hypothetical protein [Bradyrhizobium sp.]
MRQDKHTSLEEEITIDVSKAVAAYERFKQLKSFRSDTGGIAYELNKAILARLQQMKAEYHANENFLASKQNFSVWRKGAPQTAIKRRRSILLAVLALTGIDISAQSILARTPQDLSDMVELGPLKSRKITNDPDEVKEAMFDVEMSSIVFKSAQTKVMTSWLHEKPKERTPQNPRESDAVEIGTVTYGLNEADVEIEYGELEKVDWTRRVSPETDSSVGRTDGCIMIWSEARQSWIVQPIEPDMMRARLEGIKLCRVRGPRGAFIELKICASREQLSDEFRVRDADTRAAKVLKGDELVHARERLFSIVLSHRAGAKSILAVQRHKLP